MSRPKLSTKLWKNDSKKLKTEILENTIIISGHLSQLNDQLMKQILDETEKAREDTLIRLGQYQQLEVQYYNERVKLRKFQVEDCVIRKVF